MFANDLRLNQWTIIKVEFFQNNRSTNEKFRFFCRLDFLQSEHDDEPHSSSISNHETSLQSNDLIDTNNDPAAEEEEEEEDLQSPRKSNTFNGDLTVFFFR